VELSDLNGTQQALGRSGGVVYGSGLLALDVLVPNDGSGVQRQWAGGTCANVLTVLSYLGWKSFPVARLADDIAGRQVCADLSTWNVHLDHVHESPAASTPIFIEILTSHEGRAATHRFTSRCPRCGSRFPPFQPITVAAAAKVAAKMESIDVFFMDRVSPGILLLAEEARTRGALVVFEPSGVGDVEQFQAALSISHIIKCAFERLGDTLETFSVPFNRVEIVTQGSHGLRMRSGFSSHHCPTWEHFPGFGIDAVTDAAGAGDWCTAGLIHSLGLRGSASLINASGARLREGIRLGQALAAWNCSFLGARSGMYSVSPQALEIQIRKLSSNDFSGRLMTAKEARVSTTPVRQLCSTCVG
jgi:sugar/nucleoside kinase (ribokinase family)